VTTHIEDVEGIGLAYGERLRHIGIDTPAKLLAQGATPSGRQQLATETGIEQQRLLKWINLCDLCRISGISRQYSELLEAAGVDTVKELRNRKVENLAASMRKINTKKKLVKQLPSEKDIATWVAQAKNIPPMIRD